jgi:hypothetical protein
VVQLLAVGASLGSAQLERKDSDRVAADLALVTLLLAFVALVEVCTKRLQQLGEIHLLLGVVNVVQILQTKEVEFKAVINAVAEQSLDELGVAD